MERKGKSDGHNKTPRKVETKIIRNMKTTKKPLSMRDVAVNSRVSKSTAWRVVKKIIIAIKNSIPRGGLRLRSKGRSP